MNLGRKWIIGMAALGLVAVWLIVRHEKEIAHDTASREGRHEIRTTAPSNKTSDGADHGLAAESRPSSGLVDLPTTLQADELETHDLGTRFLNGNEAKPRKPRTARVEKEAGMVASEEDRAENPGQSTQAAVASPPAGIQLAPDVRLPVAALPIDFETNEVTAKMLDIIVDDYYRDLAAGVTGDEEGTQTTLLEDNGESTILVNNGPVAEAARKRADWRFRTIFGAKAYNRMSMQSNLEARLPVAPPVNGNE